MNLEALKAARALVLDVQQWHVEQHPLNVYPPDHPYYAPPRPCPASFKEADEAWNAIARTFPWRDSPLIEDPKPGTLALWNMQSALDWIVPVRLVRRQGRLRRGE